MSDEIVCRKGNDLPRSGGLATRPAVAGLLLDQPWVKPSCRGAWPGLDHRSVKPSINYCIPGENVWGGVWEVQLFVRNSATQVGFPTGERSRATR
jgi:hypothetical protein